MNNTSVNDLVDTSGELLNRLSDVNTPEIAALKTRVADALANAKAFIAKGASQVGEQAKEAAGVVDDYGHDSPWIAIGFVAVLAGALGFAAGAATAQRKKILGLF